MRSLIHILGIADSLAATSEKPVRINLKRGFWRLWVVLSAFWIAGCSFLIYQSPSNQTPSSGSFFYLPQLNEASALCETRDKPDEQKSSSKIMAGPWEKYARDTTDEQKSSSSCYPKVSDGNVFNQFDKVEPLKLLQITTEIQSKLDQDKDDGIAYINFGNGDRVYFIKNDLISEQIKVLANRFGEEIIKSRTNKWNLYTLAAHDFALYGLLPPCVLLLLSWILGWVIRGFAS